MNARVSLHWPLSYWNVCVCVCVCVRACACVHVCTVTEETWKIDFLTFQWVKLTSVFEASDKWGGVEGYIVPFSNCSFLKKIFIFWSIVALCVSFCLQQSESVIHISPLLGTSFSFRSPQSSGEQSSIEQSSLCHTAK